MYSSCDVAYTVLLSCFKIDTVFPQCKALQIAQISHKALEIAIVSYSIAVKQWFSQSMLTIGLCWSVIWCEDGYGSIRAVINV